MIKIRKVTKEDCDLLLQWRNNPEVYKYALNPNPVNRDEHVQWFERQLISNRCFFYIGMIDGVTCGSVRYQLNEKLDEAEVSISVAPEFWGKGIAFEMMALAELNLKAESSVKIIHATVLNENVSSMKLFQKSQFNPVQTQFIKTL